MKTQYNARYLISLTVLFALIAAPCWGGTEKVDINTEFKNAIERSDRIEVHRLMKLGAKGLDLSSAQNKKLVNLLATPAGYITKSGIKRVGPPWNPRATMMLQNAINNNNLDEVITALHNNADPNADPMAFFTAFGYDNKEVVAQLIRAGANINIINKGSGSTPLMAAIGSHFPNSTEIASKLIQAGADVNTENMLRGKITALMIAAYWFEIPKVQLLLDNGADIDLTNAQGETVLDIATQQRNTARNRENKAGEDKANIIIEMLTRGG